MAMNLNKRKRDVSVQDLKSKSIIPKSTSSICIVQPLLKKMKKKNKKMTIPLIKDKNNVNKNYRSVFIFFIFIQYHSDFIGDQCI
jgi:hypothetical protein